MSSHPWFGDVERAAALKKFPESLEEVQRLRDLLADANAKLLQYETELESIQDALNVNDEAMYTTFVKTAEVCVARLESLSGDLQATRDAFHQLGEVEPLATAFAVMVSTDWSYAALNAGQRKIVDKATRLVRGG